MKNPNHGLESTGAPPAAGTLETHPYRSMSKINEFVRVNVPGV